MLTLKRLVVCAILITAASFAIPASDAADDLRGMRYLDNGTIRLGIDLDRGGAITYLSRSGHDENVVNNYDLGRQIQMSFYSGPAPFTVGEKKPAPHWAHIGWNPIQTGDDFRHGSRVLEFQSDPKQHTLFVRCIPMQWPLDDVPAECEFQLKLKLVGPTVHAEASLRNHRDDKRQFAARHQELPAVYVNGPYYRLVSYTGEKPFTDEAQLTTFETTNGRGMPWRHFHPTENWAALLRDDDFGLGLYHPDCYEFSGGFSGPTGSGGERDAPTGYLAPVRREIIDHDIAYDYRYVLILGKLDEIRSRATALAKQAPHRAHPRPDYRFTTDRQHCYYSNAHDAGLPIRGGLEIRYDAADPQWLGPVDFWQAADAPKLFITAAFRQNQTFARLFWQRLGQHGMTEKQALKFDIVPDGKLRTYEIDLAAHPEYQGAIVGLRLDPTEQIETGDGMRLEAISAQAPAP